MASISVPTIAAVGTEAAADGAAAASAAAAAGTAAAVGTAAGTAALTASTTASLATAAAGTTATLAGAGGSLFTLGNLATAGSLLSGGLGAYQKHEQGVAMSNDAKDKARQAGLEAAQKQINIRQNMLRALGSQNAQAGQGGIGTGGSFGANVNRQIGQNQNDLLALSADTSGQQQQYGQQAAAATQGGNLGAGLSLLDSGSKFASGLS